MARNINFDREAPLPSYFVNVIQDILSGGVFDFQITQKNSTTIQVVPRQPNGLAALIIQNKWRFNTAAVERAVPGNGTWTIWAVALNDDVDDSPDPFTDHTTYTWDLRMTDGSNPSGTGVEIFEAIGTVKVSGGAIYSLKQTAYNIRSEQIEEGGRTGTMDLTGSFDLGATPGLTRFGDGMVLMDGNVDGGSISSGTTNIGTIPMGFRPSVTIYRVDAGGRLVTIGSNGAVAFVTGVGPAPSMTVRFPGWVWKAAP